VNIQVAAGKREIKTNATGRKPIKKTSGVK
jgi:hypothetical protein